jgi:hypothetical protein
MLAFSSLSPSFLLLSVLPPPTFSYTHLSNMKFWIGCMPWRLNYARSVILGGVPFRMSLFNFRVLLFLCERNVRNEFHCVISPALTGLCHLSLDGGFTFGFLPCLGFWPIPLSPGNFTSQYSLRWMALLQEWLITLGNAVISFIGIAYYYFLRTQVSWILSLEQCWFVINPMCIYFCS